MSTKVWADPFRHPRVVVEAKLGHELSVQQVRTYADDLVRRSDVDGQRSLMVVLVPEHRRREAEDVIAQARRSDNHDLLMTVWSYDQVLAALTASLGANPDLEQLRGLIQVSEALDIKPFTQAELDTKCAARHADLVRVVALASSALSNDGRRVLPSRTQDPDFEWMRYVEVNPDKTCIGVGVRRSPEHLGVPSWIWVRVHRGTYNAESAGRLLEEVYPGRAALLTDGTTWMPLTVPVGVGGAAMQQALLDQLTEITRVLSHCVDDLPS
ncbi:hypothetical protein [Nocardioides aquaticus]|nr:hypothetical protein [Nocardioides aquaticus]